MSARDRDNGRHLYFMLNRWTGLIKIGIAYHVGQRKQGLECAAGVALELLVTIENGWQLEKPLHEVFDAERQMGEWFLPCDALLDLIANPSGAADLIKRSAPAMAVRRKMKAEAEATEKSAREADRLSALEEKRRIERERKAALAVATAKRQAAAEKRAAAITARKEAEYAAWRESQQRDAEAKGFVSPEAAAEAERRMVRINAQRARNQALVGIKAAP